MTYSADGPVNFIVAYSQSTYPASHPLTKIPNKTFHRNRKRLHLLQVRPPQRLLPQPPPQPHLPARQRLRQRAQHLPHLPPQNLRPQERVHLGHVGALLYAQAGGVRDDPVCAGRREEEQRQDEVGQGLERWYRGGLDCCFRRCVVCWGLVSEEAVAEEGVVV
jgi:hypothetical protein